jgi:Bacterial Ig domain/Divergent InlB B-repeat domain/RTX calcium-binding nonapeptide repeat (4 copies)
VSDHHREYLPLGFSRAGRLALAVFVGALLVASASLGSAQAEGGCSPIIRTLTNGDPASVEGAVRVTVDGLGAYGRGTAAGDAVFNPPGSFAAALPTTFTSNLYLSSAARMLADDCADGQVEVISESPLTTRITIGPLLVELTQELEPVTAGGSTLRQTYTFTDNGDGTDVTLVRHLDGDLRFDGSSGTQDGAAASAADGRTLFELDSVSTAVPRAFLALSGSLAGDETPDRWTIQPFNYRNIIVGAGGIPEGDNGVVFLDDDEDLIADSPYDVTLSQQWDASIAAEASVVLVTSARFDAENRSPDAVADAAGTTKDTLVDIDVRANDGEPDGDPLTVESVTQPAHGAASIQSDWLVRYVPAAGFDGSDSFTYTLADGRGGTDTATVTLTVGARFALTVAKTGNGRVTSVPPRIDCGATCVAEFDAGTSVTLTAIPDPGWTFAGWNGQCGGLGACTVIIDAAKTVGADFLPPPPTGGESANVVVSRGTVLVRLPGTPGFVELDGAAQVPVGSQLDTTAGAVDVTISRGAALDTSEFYDGVFTILQANASAIGELRLGGGDFSRCLPSFRVLATRRPVRKLWGSGKGRFRTRGRYSSATVRGTKWLTQDLCEGTLVTVEEGTVLVRDISRRRNIVVRAGRSYLAEPLPRGVRRAGCTVIGTSRRDFLRGTKGRDVICGLGGDDVLSGLGANDRLIGGPGNDRLLGGDGDDVLLGNAGRDFLNGGLGDDVLEGGAGNDFMVAHDGGRGNDRVRGGPGRDRCDTDWVKVCP